MTFEDFLLHRPIILHKGEERFLLCTKYRRRGFHSSCVLFVQVQKQRPQVAHSKSIHDKNICCKFSSRKAIPFFEDEKISMF